MVILQGSLTSFSQCDLFLGFCTCDSLLTHEGQVSIMERMFWGLENIQIIFKAEYGSPALFGFGFSFAKVWERESIGYLGFT